MAKRKKDLEFQGKELEYYNALMKARAEVTE